MKNTILVLFLTLISFNAFGEPPPSYKIRTCFTDYDNRCFIVTIDKATAAIRSITQQPNSPYIPELTQSFKDVGIWLTTPPRDGWNVIAKNIDEEVRTTVSDSVLMFNNVSDAQWDAYIAGGLCVGTAAGCGIASFQTASTLGLSSLITVVACTTALLTCADAIRKIQKWSAVQKAASDKEAANAGIAPGRSGTGGPGTSPIPGGTGTPITRKSRGKVEVWDPVRNAWL